MTTHTVFYSHPYHCYEGEQYTVDRASALIAGEEAAAIIPEDMWLEDSNEQDYLELAAIRDKLVVEVFEGTHESRPDRRPDYALE